MELWIPPTYNYGYKFFRCSAIKIEIEEFKFYSTMCQDFSAKVRSKISDKYKLSRNFIPSPKSMTQIFIEISGMLDGEIWLVPIHGCEKCFRLSSDGWIDFMETWQVNTPQIIWFVVVDRRSLWFYIESPWDT